MISRDFGKKQNESKIVNSIMDMLSVRGWFCIKIHGNKYQKGLPDIYAAHSSLKTRWIEVKDPTRTGDVFTPAQHAMFPLMMKHGAPVWVLTGHTRDQYFLLFDKANYWHHNFDTIVNRWSPSHQDLTFNESPVLWQGRGELETTITKALMAKMRSLGWLVVKMHGNMYQAGMPDLYAVHPAIGERWIEVKSPHRTGDWFTVAQREVFPKMGANGAPIWVLTSVEELWLLGEPPNFWKML